MPRYKPTETGLKLIGVDFAKQLLPGSFEHALRELIDSGEIDVSGLEARLRNDACGAPAYDPRVLLKIVLLAHGARSPAEIDALLERVARYGANVTQKGQPADWGGHSGYFTDLDGLLWEVPATRVSLACDRRPTDRVTGPAGNAAPAVEFRRRWTRSSRPALRTSRRP